MNYLDKPLNLTIAQTLYVHAAKFGGVTLNKLGGIVTSGYVSGVFESGLIFDSISETNEHIISKFITDYKPDFIGSWLDSKTGKVYIDEVKVFTNLDVCRSFALRNGQIAIYDLDNAKEIRI